MSHRILMYILLVSRNIFHFLHDLHSDVFIAIKKTFTFSRYWFLAKNPLTGNNALLSSLQLS